MIDFTNCRVIPGRAYNGANGSKIAVDYNNEVYMLKFPPSGVGKPTLFLWICINRTKQPTNRGGKKK